jgi:hypothetical protein
MKRKWIMFVASFSLALVIILPVVTSIPGDTNIIIQTQGHGWGGG